MNFLAQLTIKKRLMAISIVVAVALSFLFVMMLVNGSQLSKLGSLSAQVTYLEAQVLTLRRNEKDFLARKDLKYLDKFQSKVSELQRNIGQIKIDAEALGISLPEIIKFEKAVVSYATQFDKLVEFQTQIGLTPKDGLYGELRQAVHEVESLLKENDSYRLLADMLQLRRAEKDFMLRRDTKYLDKFESTLSTFRQDLPSENIDQNSKSNINSGLSSYEQKFKQLVSAEVEIGLDSKSGLLGQLRSTIHSTETSLESMMTLMGEAIEQQVFNSKRNGIIAFFLAMIFTLLAMYSTSQSILKPVLAVRNAIAHIRNNNDLTWLVRSKGKDELVDLADDVNTLVSDFRQLIENVNQALSTLDNATVELAENTQHTLDGMEQQFTESDMVATSGAEMQATVSDISQNTKVATDTANQTGELANEGSSEVNKTAEEITELSNQLKNALTQIEALEKDSQLIGTVSDAIRGIAEQTNLLALNAAIEAARAGEQGRGFAVVADEVRSLAMRTQDSTSEIESIISSLQSSTQTIVAVVNKCYQDGINCSEQAQRAGESLQQISQQVNQVVDMNSQISTSLNEQDQVATEMSKHVIKIRDIAHESQQRAATNAEASRDIAQQAVILHQEVERYKITK